MAIWYRLMDAVEPRILDAAEASIRQHEDVRELRRLRMRWMDYLSEVIVHVDPYGPAQDAYHEHTVHHEPAPRPIG